MTQQTLDKSFLPVFEEIKSCLKITNYMLENIIINDSVVKEDKYKYIFSVDVVNQYVLEGMSFRDAYQKVGMDIEKGDFEPIMKNKHTHEGSLGNLCNEKVQASMQQLLSEFDFKSIDKALETLLSE